MYQHCVDQHIEEMSSDRLSLAFRRAVKALGLEGMTIDCDSLPFRRAFGEQLGILVAEDILDELQATDVATVVDIDPQGERLWSMAAA